MKKVLCALAAFAAFASFAPVYGITYKYDAGVLHETAAFASFNTTGAEMAGMGVHVVYSDGSIYDATWQKLSTGFGGVTTTSGMPFQITAGNTGNNSYSWLLYNSLNTASIVSVSLDGQPGSTVFDLSFPFGQFAGFNFVGTTGTSTGREFELSSLYGIYNGLTVTYSDAVAITGTAAVGDVFRRMTIDFAPDRLLAGGGLLEFKQDTDSLAFGSVLAPTQPAGVPDGGSVLVMVSAGFLGLATCARRRAAILR